MARLFVPPQWQPAANAGTCPDCGAPIAPKALLLVWPGSTRFLCEECAAWFAPNYSATVHQAQANGQW